MRPSGPTRVLLLPARARVKVVGVHAVLAKIEALEFLVFTHANADRPLEEREKTERSTEREDAVARNPDELNEEGMLRVGREDSDRKRAPDCPRWRR